MSVTPTNRQLAILAVLRRGEERTVKGLAQTVSEEMPPCSECGGRQSAAFECRRCYGFGKPMIHYGEVYVDLKRLMGLGLVARRRLTNEFGDELNFHVYRALPVEQSVDELERAFAAPTAEQP